MTMALSIVIPATVMAGGGMGAYVGNKIGGVEGAAVGALVGAIVSAIAIGIVKQVDVVLEVDGRITCRFLFA